MFYIPPGQHYSSYSFAEIKSVYVRTSPLYTPISTVCQNKVLLMMSWLGFDKNDMIHFIWILEKLGLFKMNICVALSLYMNTMKITSQNYITSAVLMLDSNKICA